MKVKFPFMYANMKYANEGGGLVQAHRNLCLISADNLPRYYLQISV